MGKKREKNLNQWKQSIKLLFYELSLKHFSRKYLVVTSISPFLAYYIYIYIYIYIRVACLATLKSCDPKKQSVCGWQYIGFHTREWSILAKELTAATCLMQSSSNELITSVSDSVKCKRAKVDTYTLNSQAAVESPDGREVFYLSEVKLRRFEVFSRSRYIEELWYNETVCGRQYIHIYMTVVPKFLSFTETLNMLYASHLQLECMNT